jgi:Ca-activated chloride channel homolog
MGGTALGSGLLTSLSAIAGRAVTVDEAGQGGAPDDLGYYGSSAVILLSDGENTVEPDPLELAEAASVSGVRVYPIGLGSPAGTVLKIDDFMVATALDEKLLRQIATTTDGRYFRAADQRALAEVYDSIDPAWTIRARRMEVTGLFSAAAGVLLLAGALLSLRWYGRVL